MMKKMINVLALTACAMVSVSANAAHYCNAFVDSIRVTSSGASVYTSSSWNNARHDPMTLSYADANFSYYLQKLSQAKANDAAVKIYILEEFDGDDASSCKDGVTDYIGSVH